MAAYTQRYNLKLPGGADYYSVEDMNDNTAKLDASAKKSELDTEETHRRAQKVNALLYPTEDTDNTVSILSEGAGVLATAVPRIASGNADGWMSKSSFLQIQQNSVDIQDLKNGQSGADRGVFNTLSEANTPENLPSGANQFCVIRQDEEYEGATTHRASEEQNDGGYYWKYEYIINNYSPQATNTTLGLVKGSVLPGKSSVENDGTLSLNGWDSLNNKASAAKSVSGQLNNQAVLTGTPQFLFNPLTSITGEILLNIPYTQVSETGEGTADIFALSAVIPIGTGGGSTGNFTKVTSGSVSVSVSFSNGTRTVSLYSQYLTFSGTPGVFFNYTLFVQLATSAEMSAVTLYSLPLTAAQWETLGLPQGTKVSGFAGVVQSNKSAQNTLYCSGTIGASGLEVIIRNDTGNYSTFPSTTQSLPCNIN